ncbi:MAG: helix-turn-helix domain-containing protein [Terasakiella sp.]|uniref:helix-turn-helix domain-containing protein n=1 Tax=unclassified Terasakiella TaxID=2614952 RepID=UPI003B00FC3C
MSELKQLTLKVDEKDKAISPFDQTVGWKIRTAREKLGISRIELSRRTKISQNSLARYELAGEEGGQFPPLPKFALICMELNLDPREVLELAVPFEVEDGSILRFKYSDFKEGLAVDPEYYDSAFNKIEELANILLPGNYQETLSILQESVKHAQLEQNKLRRENKKLKKELSELKNGSKS